METAQLCPPAIRDALARAHAALAALPGASAADLRLALEAAEVLGALTEDLDHALAALARPLLASGPAEPRAVAAILGERAAGIAGELAGLGEIRLPEHWSPEKGLDPRQAETLRNMLLAVVRDPRLVLARLAEALVRLRHARDLPQAEAERIALEARVIHGPLANRLGIWQVKWELEDLAFRWLEPEDYRRIASALNERRADRERYIRDLCDSLRAELAAAGVQAEVHGRPKHIYSIHRKMQRKQLAFEQLFDVRAVRIVVGSLADCYAALGVVHGRWPYIPGEFDDYIATPKDNFYRSIHTAVIGPEGKSVEVQIRTREMHEHAELGVAAHWQYKEGGPRDADYERKIQWVRRLLEPQPDGGADRDFLDGIRAELFEDRVYALTPKGEVVDLPRGATPLDFAYHVHTGLGHRCRGAKVNGRIVPLTYALQNGEIVEIITGRQQAPSRDWLAPEQGYLVSARNRAKVRAWFRRLDAGDNRAAGKAIADRELARLGAGPDSTAAIVQELRADTVDRMHQLLGEGEITVTQLVQAATRVLAPARRPAPVLPRKRATAPKRSGSPVEVEGVGDLPITLARCCTPIRPQPIVGYAPLGRGVTIHRSDCPAFVRMKALKPDRVFNVEWSGEPGASLPVEIGITAYDRRGLLRDVTDTFAQERLSIEAMNTVTDHRDGKAHLTVRLDVQDLDQLARLLRRLADVPNVIHARRVH